MIYMPRLFGDFFLYYYYYPQAYLHLTAHKLTSASVTLKLTDPVIPAKASMMSRDDRTS